MPDYAIRSAIMIDLIKKCKLIRYNPILIGFYCGKKRVRSLEYVVGQIGDVDKEVTLCEILYDGLARGFSLRHFKEAEAHGLENAYEKIIEIWENLDE